MVEGSVLFRDFYWRSRLLLLPASGGLDIGQEEPLSAIVCAQTACLSGFP